MRNFYVYNINEYFQNTYLNYPYKLYKMLEDAYLTKNYSISKAAPLYKEIIIPFNKLFINNYLAINNKLDIHYHKRDNEHFISNNPEYTKLQVNSYCLKITSNLNYPKFFNSLTKYDKTIFICDFDNKDYFWLNKIKKQDSLIKNQI